MASTGAATIEAPLDFRTICNELKVVKYKYYEVGVQMGIPHDQLMLFNKEDDPMAMSVDYWLKGNTEVPISWKSIVQALQSSHVGLAKRISEKYCGSSSPLSYPESVAANSSHDITSGAGSSPLDYNSETVAVMEAKFCLISWENENSVTVVPLANVVGEAIEGTVCRVKLGRGKYTGKIIAIGTKAEMSHREEQFIDESSDEDEVGGESGDKSDEVGDKIEGKEQPPAKKAKPATSHKAKKKTETKKKIGSRQKGETKRKAKETEVKRTTEKGKKKKGSIIQISLHDDDPPESVSQSASTSTHSKAVDDVGLQKQQPSAPLDIQSDACSTQSQPVINIDSDSDLEDNGSSVSESDPIHLEVTVMDIDHRLKTVESTQKHMIQQLSRLQQQSFGFSPPPPPAPPPPFPNYSSNFFPPGVNYGFTPNVQSPPTSLSSQTIQPPATPARPQKSQTSVGSPLPLNKLQGNALPSSAIDKSKLLSVESVIEQYPKLKMESKAGTLACKIAKQALFGGEVMKQCTPIGNRELPGLPAKELKELKKIMFMRFPQYWKNPAEFESVWKKCLESVQQGCKRLRLGKDKDN